MPEQNRTPTAIRGAKEVKQLASPTAPTADPGVTVSYTVFDSFSKGNWGPGAGKHGRLAFNPDDGLIYRIGGDYAGGSVLLNGEKRDAGGSGRQEIYTLNPATNTWRVKFPYCAPEGEVTFHGPDQIGWVWDSRRHVFWALPGMQYSAWNNPCPGVKGKVMIYHPDQNQWTVPKTTNQRVDVYGSASLRPKFAQYDAVTDRIYMLYGYSGTGAVLIFDPSTLTWSVTREIIGGTYSGSYTALVERRIYTLSMAGRNRPTTLMYWDIDTHESRTVVTLPFSARHEYAHLAYDPENNGFLISHFAGSDPRMYWYDLDSKQLTDISDQVPGRMLRSRHFLWVPPKKAFFVGVGNRSGVNFHESYWLKIR